METTDPRANLLSLSATRGVSLAALSAMIGRNASYLQQFVKKGSPRKLEEADRRKLARFFGVDESLLGGVVEGAAKEKSFAPAPFPTRRQGDWADVPRLDLDAAAGVGALNGNESPYGVLRFSSGWLRQQGLDPAHLSAINVSGDSMQPTLRDGDEILVDRSPRALRDGIHVVRVGEGLLVKRLDLARPGRIGLISDNPAYPPLDLAREEVEIIGRVVWKGGRL